MKHFLRRNWVSLDEASSVWVTATELPFGAVMRAGAEDVEEEEKPKKKAATKKKAPAKKKKVCCC